VKSQEIVVYGSGGFAREVAWLAEECEHNVVCFIDDDLSRAGKTLNDLPVLTIDDAAKRFQGAAVVAGIGSPKARAAVMARAAGAGFPAASLIHPRVEKSRWVEFGKGVVICAGNILTTNIVIGNYVQVNLDCTIGHDVTLGEYATLAPGVHVSGCVNVGRRAYIGTGAVIINGTQSEPLIIGDDAVIGAGACVTRSVEPSTTAVGVPAKALAKR
jgi:sugar O-acyltransferase (sialic acid O-acetyltransferase NeuD family)